MLASQRPPLTKAEFEDSLRRSLLVDKLRASLTDWMTVTDADVTGEFKRRNEKVKVELVVLHRRQVPRRRDRDRRGRPTWFDAHKEDYRIGEKRKIKYLLVDATRCAPHRSCRRATSRSTTATTSRSSRRPSRCARATS